MPRMPEADHAPLHPATPEVPRPGPMIPARPVYSILRISAASYADIRARLVALDEAAGDGLNQYQRDFILPPGNVGAPERLLFGDTAFEAEE